MGTLICCFSETLDRFVPAFDKLKLDVENQRRVLMSSYRYCLGGDYFYVPADGEGVTPEARLCWARVKSHMSLDRLNADYAAGLVPTSTDYHAPWNTFGQILVVTGNDYLKRRRETKEGFVEVPAFVSETLLEELDENQEALPSVSKDDFEALCAELFFRRGFGVDLFRSTKDGGIDFLAVKSDEDDPIILAVQCKQPDLREGRRRRSLGRPVVQQIYGAAKAFDLDGAVAISGSTYSREAKEFADLKSLEIKVHDQEDLIKWIRRYRWNDDE